MTVIVASFATQEVSQWLSDMLLNAGVAVMLLAPIIYLTRRIERSVNRQIKDVEAEIDASQQRLKKTLDEIDAGVQTRLSDDADRATELFEALRSAPSQEDVKAAVAFAQDWLIASSYGARVGVAGGELYVRYLVRDGVLRLAIDDGFTANIMVYEWSPGVAPSDAFTEIARRLRLTASWPTVGEFHGATTLAGLADIYAFGLNARKRGEYSMRKLIQLVGAEWALTETALVSRAHPHYTVALQRLPKEMNWYEHLGDKLWVDDKGLLAQALGLGEGLLGSVLPKEGVA
ncbi:hypothetical protein AB0L70_35745 [Kribbella sp. NPDC051952]|uniref:hypothetical protein n=1 Tax=Kribbella sp. NPDC051952 TaxID=3154851 RepID=UPI00341FB3B4